MSRVAVFGGTELLEAARSLELEVVSDAAELAVVDADDDASVGAAALLPGTLPRVFIAGVVRAALLRAAGAPHVLERPLTAARLGPIVFALERAREAAPRIVLFIAATGATGRTSLVANLALRLAVRAPALAIDATGTGALAWRLGATVAPWPDLAAVGDELGEAHLRLAAAERDGALIVGGVGSPSAALLRGVIERARGLGAVLVDGPAPAVARDLARGSERVYVCANPDPASAAVTAAVFGDLLGAPARLVVSQARERDVTRLAALFGVPPTFVLPPDEPSCRDALRRRGRTNGALGRAYDAIAEILLADVEP